jgi:hypothetical protein
LILAAALILGLLGPLDPVPERIGIALALCLWAASRLAPLDDGDVGAPAARWRRCVPPAAVACGAALLLAAESVETRLALVTAMALAMPAPARRADGAFGAGVLCLRLLLQGVPWIWQWEVEISRLVSRGVGILTGQKLDFGPTVSGLDLLLLFALYAAVSRPAGRVPSFRRLGGAVAITVIYIAILPSAAASATLVPFDRVGLFNMAREHLAPRPDQIARVMFGWPAVLFALLCLAWMGAWGRESSVPALPPSGLPRRRAAGGWGVAGLAVLLITLMIVADRPAGERRPGEVVILKSPAFDMEVPARGRFGAGRAGMFGMLPRYLELDGHRTRVHEGGLTAAATRDASILVVALPTAPFTREELSVLESFVASGGALLALGDHTDLLGTMGPMNRLLAPWGIALRFDSAYPAVHEWQGCVDGPGGRRHVFTGIGTGASLQIGAGARPLVIGRHAISDAGDRNNTGRGAFLGNYGYDSGERIADLVLAARARHGLGQVAVFGDTSSFQNLVLPFSYPFVAGLMDDFARPAPRARDLARALAGITAALLGLLAVAGSRPAPGGLVGAVLALQLTALMTGAGGAPLDRLPEGSRVALIDTGHLNRFSLDLWHDDSIGGLIVNLERDGYLPIAVDDGFAHRPMRRAFLPVLVAPQAPFSPAELRALERHLEEGGDLLVAAGPAQNRAVTPLLSRHGVAIQDLPLGPVPIRPNLDQAAFELARKEPRFREAWPVVTDPRWSSISLYRAFDHDVVVRVEVGSRGGQLLVIGDPAFLTDRVLENETTAWEGNVRLLEDLLQAEGGA